MELSKELFIICPLIFLSGFIDSIAGGGGLISLPVYNIFLKGIPMQSVLGTNKFSSVWGTSISSFKFIKNKKYHLSSAIVSVIFALIGSAIGAQLTLLMDEKFLRYFLIVAMPLIAVFILTKKDFGDEKEKNLPLSKIILLSGVFSFLIGIYDGFFGPGTGTFLAIIYSSVIGFDIVTASGNAKITNFASNIAAVTTFISTDNVLYSVAIPAAVFSILGNYLGSHLALKNGKKIIKPLFVVVLVLLLLTLVFQIISSNIK